MKKPGLRLTRTLKTQLTVYMVIIVAFALIFIIFTDNYFYTQAMEDMTTDHTTQMLTQIKANIDNYVQTADRVITYLSQDESILGYLRLEDFYDGARVDLETRARGALRVYARSNRELFGGILVVNRYDLYISNEMYRVARNPLVAESWFRQAVAADGLPVLISKPIGRNLQNYHNYSAVDIVSVVRAVKDPVSGEILGVICADVLLSAIENHIRNITLGKNGYVFIMDDRGEMVYAPIQPSAYRIRSEWVADQGPAIYRINDKNYQLLSTYSDLTRWRIIGVFNSDEVLLPVARLRNYTLLAGILAIIATTIAALFFSKSFTEPISKLRKLMAKAGAGDLSVQYDSKNYYGELAQLGTSFNSMMGQIHHLVDIVYMEQNLKREAEIKTLQAQIKPHFLYNTLDTIRWIAEAQNPQEVVRLVGALTKLFRISLSRGHEIITLGDELEHVRSYLYIQKVRYEDKLNYVITCEEAYYPLMINKLILQPLVENAIYHGIKQKQGEGHISLTVFEAENELRIEVADDGAGMSLEQCEAINQDLRAEHVTAYSHGYGLYNVNDRIRLVHGSAYGLYYRTNDAGGVTVLVRLPITLESIASKERSIQKIREG